MMQDYVGVVLPDHYDLVVGDTFQLFYRGIIEAVNPYCYDILALCEKGSNFPRYYEYTPEEPGEHVLTISVYGNDKTLLASGQTVLKVHAVQKSPEKPVNILCVGASTTAHGIWVEEVNRRLTDTEGAPKGDGLTGFRFVGTCRKEKVGFEAYGGWSWKSYITYGDWVYAPVWICCKHHKTAADQHSLWKDETGAVWILETIEKDRLKFKRHLQHVVKPEKGHVICHMEHAVNKEPIIVEASEYEAPNPFWNEETNAVDFVHYCQKHAFEKIDAVYIFLTYNGQRPDRPPVEEHCRNLKAYAKEFVDILHHQFPGAKVKIMGPAFPSVNGGTGANYGAKLPYCDKYDQIRLGLSFNRIFEEWSLQPEYREFVEFINISGQFDCEYNMPSAPKPVNTRSKVTELVGTNGLHPLPEGYLQVADAVYRNVIKEFCQ